MVFFDRCTRVMTCEIHRFQQIRRQEISLRCLVEGGHRAIIFNRLGGIDRNTVLSEGLHFR